MLKSNLRPEEFTQKDRLQQLDPFVLAKPLTDEQWEGRNRETTAAWRPTSLQTPFLLMVIGMTLGLLSLVQYLVAQSEKNEGLVFISNINDLPTHVVFGYLYLPTTIAVL